jgi:hypothetical protein
MPLAKNEVFTFLKPKKPQAIFILQITDKIQLNLLDSTDNNISLDLRTRSD